MDNAHWVTCSSTLYERTNGNGTSPVTALSLAFALAVALSLSIANEVLLWSLCFTAKDAFTKRVRAYFQQRTIAECTQTSNRFPAKLHSFARFNPHAHDRAGLLVRAPFAFLLRSPRVSVFGVIVWCGVVCIGEDRVG